MSNYIKKYSGIARKSYDPHMLELLWKRLLGYFGDDRDVIEKNLSNSNLFACIKKGSCQEYKNAIERVEKDITHKALLRYYIFASLTTVKEPSSLLKKYPLILPEEFEKIYIELSLSSQMDFAKMIVGKYNSPEFKYQDKEFITIMADDDKLINLLRDYKLHIPILPSKKHILNTEQDLMSLFENQVLYNYFTKKLDNLCFVLISFLRYLMINRVDNGFMAVVSGKSAKETLDLTVQPKLTWSMLEYILFEMYPCKIMAELHYSTPSGNTVPRNILVTLQSVLNTKITTNIRTAIPVDPSIYQLLWKYLWNSIGTVIHDTLPVNYEDKIIFLEEEV